MRTWPKSQTTSSHKFDLHTISNSHLRSSYEKRSFQQAFVETLVIGASHILPHPLTSTPALVDGFPSSHRCLCTHLFARLLQKEDEWNATDRMH